jgi:hypothetical protein
MDLKFKAHLCKEFVIDESYRLLFPFRSGHILDFGAL